MLRNLKDLEGCVIGATDGTIGIVKDLYFDDAAWVIRYLIVSTGTWLANRKVLISPFALREPQWTQKLLRAAITKEQVKNSPDIDTERPVSRQHEIQYLNYYRYPAYWGGAAVWGVGPNPNMMPMGADYAWPVERDAAEASQNPNDNAHLRSCNAVMKYHVHASDGDIGHVRGLLVDDETWAIRYLIVDTSNWWLGHQVLVAPQWIDEVNWFDSKVSVDLTRKALKDAPPYDAASAPDRKREIEMFEHHGRSGYWAQDASTAPARPARPDYNTEEHSTTEEHKREQQPWSPTIEGEPLLNAFANPLSDAGEPHNPVLLEKLGAEGEESFEGDPLVPETIPPAVPVAEIKPAQ